jgi:hypothetical protein
MQQHQKQSPKPIKVQPKLQVNEPGDVYEQEADAMAERVMRMTDGNQRKSAPNTVTGIIGRSVQRKCAHCEEDEKKKQVMRKSQNGSGGNAVSSSFSSTLQTSKGGGASLPSGTRSVMENAFGTDFSDVRIHTDQKAQEMNNNISAKAFTYGTDIYFNAGEFQPATHEGKKLLAHELTHTIQQKNTLQRAIQRKDCVTGIPEGKGETVDIKEIPDITYVMWGTFKKGQSSYDYISQTYKNWVKWRFGNLDAATAQKMVDYGVSQIKSVNKEGDDCQHAVPVAKYVMVELRKMSGETDAQKKEQQDFEQVTEENKEQDEQPSTPIKQDLSVLKDVDLAKRLLLMLEHYSHKPIDDSDKNMAADGLSEDEVTKLIDDKPMRKAVVKLYTQAYVDFQNNKGSEKESFFKLSEVIIEQFSKGNPTATHNYLKIGYGIKGMELPDGRKEGEILGIINRQTDMLLYDADGMPLGGIGGVGKRDKGYTVSRGDSSWGINIANIKDPALRSLLNSLRQTFGDEARMTAQAAQIYYDNCDLVNAKVRAGLTKEIIEKFEDMLPVFVGFIAGHALSSFLMRFPNPPVFAVGAALKALLTVAGYIMDIDFAEGALKNLLEAAYHISRIEKDENGQMTKLSDEHLEQGAIPIRKMVSDIALMAAMYGLGKLLGKIKAGEGKAKIECTFCELDVEGEGTEGKKGEELPEGTDKIVDEENLNKDETSAATPADILGHNLEKAGDPRPGITYEPHHIVPEGMEGAAEARQILENGDVKINDAENGVWLRRTTRGGDTNLNFSEHDTIHSAKYVEAVTEILRTHGAKDGLFLIKSYLEIGHKFW